MTGETRTEKDRFETAADWTLRLEEGLSTDEVIEFDAWISEDPANAEALAQQAAILSAPLSDLHTHEDEDADVQVVPAQDRADSGRAMFGETPVWFGVGAVLACLVLAVSVWPFIPSEQDSEPSFSVARYGADHEVAESVLDDGSRLWVDALSQTQVRYSDTQRRITVERGGVFAEVQPNTARPFVIEAGPVSVTAVGTAYEVQHRQGGITISVAEGQVRVRDQAGQVFELVAGQFASRTRDANWSILDKPLPQIASWRAGRLVVSRERLADLAERMNQYREAPILIDGPAGEATLSGVFSIQSEDADRMVQALAETVEGCVVTQPSGAMLITQDQSLCS